MIRSPRTGASPTIGSDAAPTIVAAPLGVPASWSGSAPLRVPASWSGSAPLRVPASWSGSAPLRVPARVRDGLLRVTRVLTTPLLPDDYLGMINPLWSARELRGRVEAVRRVGPSTTELTIRPGVGWGGHRPGQHVGIGVALGGRWHWRTYSLTNTPGDELLTVAVTATPDGSVSAHLARVAQLGDVLRLGPAAGDFAVPEQAPSSLLMITGGSGITPVLGMLRGLAGTRSAPEPDPWTETRSAPEPDPWTGTRSAAEPDPSTAVGGRAAGPRDVVVVHSGRSAGELVHGSDLRELAATTPWLTLHERHTATDGRLTPADLDALVPDWRTRTAFVCGPEGMLTAFIAHYTAAGLGEAVHRERFRPPTTTVSATGGTVTFTRSKVRADAGPTTTLLDAGEDAGALLPSGCRMGICHTCVGRLSHGAVRDLQTGDLHADEGDLVQTCISAAAGDVEIDL